MDEERRPVSFDELPLVLRVKDVLPVLGVCSNTVYELIRCGRLRSIRVGRQLRILRKDLEAFLRQEAQTEFPTDLK